VEEVHEQARPWEWAVPFVHTSIWRSRSNAPISRVDGWRCQSPPLTPPTPLSESSLRAPRRRDSDNLLPTSEPQCLRGKSLLPLPRHAVVSRRRLRPRRFTTETRRHRSGFVGNYAATGKTWRRFTNRPAHGNGQSRSFTPLSGGRRATHRSLTLATNQRAAIMPQQ